MRTASRPHVHTALLRRGRAHLARVQEASDAFFRKEADAVSRACRDMAGRFQRDGRLLAFGDGSAATDAYHVSVEFVHPVLVGKRALPALVLEAVPSRGIGLLGGPEDIAVGISSGPRTPAVEEALRAARGQGLLTVALEGMGGPEAAPPANPVEVDHRFVMEESDPTTVQEVHETLYHVLWELVHVFLDHGGLAGPEGPPK